MKKEYPLEQNEFDALLLLFSDDREEAGRAYERLRRGLVRYFSTKGCSECDELADETLSRVASKARTFDPSMNVKPAAFAYGFASKVYLEYARDPRLKAVELDPASHTMRARDPSNENPDESTLECLDRCLATLPAEDRDLIVSYYSKEKQERIALRRRMADELGCRMEVLHVRVYRIRAALKKCVQECAKKK